MKINARIRHSNQQVFKETKQIKNVKNKRYVLVFRKNNERKK